MASTRSVIEIEIRAAVEHFRDAVRGAQVELARMSSILDENDKAFARLGKGIAGLLKSIAAVGAIGNAVGLIAGLTTTIVNLLPAALILPGALTAAAVAMATFKLATSGVADALGGDAEAMAKLAPSARAFVEQINALKPAFDNLRKAVQQKFFENFAGDVKNIAAIYLPLLNRQLPQIAEEFNRMGRSVTRALVEAPAQSDIQEILENTTTTLGNMRQSLGHVVSGFLGLAAVGTDFLPGLGTAIDSVAFKFKHWVDEGIETGSIKASIQGALDQFKLLGEVATNIGGIVGAVFRGLSTGPQQDFLAALRDSTQALEDFLNQADTQGQLGAIGQAFSDVAKVTREVFLEALKQILPIIAELAPVFSEIARVVGDLLVNALQIVGPLLLAVAGFLRDNKELIGDLAPLVIGLWAAFKGASIITGAISALRAFSLAVGGPIVLLKAGGLIALAGLAIKLNDINQETAKIENRPLTDMEDTLSDLVGAARELVTLDFDGILSDIGDEWQQLLDGFKPGEGESPIGGFVRRLKDAVVQTGDSFAQIGGFFADFGRTTGESFATIGTTIRDKLVEAATTVGEFFTVTLPGKATEGGAALGAAITGLGTTIGTAFSDAFEATKTAIVTKFGEIKQSMTDFFSQTPYEIGLAIGTSIGQILTQIGQFGIDLKTSVDTALANFATSVQTKIDEAVAFFVAFPGKVAEALATLPQTLIDKATEAGSGFLTTISGWFDQVLGRSGQVPGENAAAVGPVGPSLIEIATSAGLGFFTNLAQGFTNTVARAGQIPGEIGAAIASVVTVLAQKAQEAGQSFINGLKTQFDIAVAFVRGIPGQISGAIGNLGGLLIGAGRSVIDGLLQGIKSGYQVMIDFVRGIADGIAANKGPLPYDKRVLRPAGLALMSGLLDGIVVGNAQVQDYVSGIAAQIAAPLNAGLTGAVGSVSLLPPTTGSLIASAQTAAADRLVAAMREQAVEVTVLLDGQPFAAMVSTALVDQDKATARVVRAGGSRTW